MGLFENSIQKWIFFFPIFDYNRVDETSSVKLAATVDGGYIHTSTDGGATWLEQTAAGIRGWNDIASSSDGKRLAAVDMPEAE